MSLYYTRVYKSNRTETNKGDYDRFFKKKDHNDKSINKNKNINILFNIDNQYFPELLSAEKQNHTTKDEPSTETELSFVKMLTLPKIVESVGEEVKPGCLSIRYDKNTRTIKHTYGPKTVETIEYENSEKMKDSLHCRMNKAIEQININQIKRIQYYDEVHGEGAYDEMFRPKIYDSEDDEEDDIDDIPSDYSETE